MKTIALIIAVTLSSLVTSAQTKKVLIIERSFAPYSSFGNVLIPSTNQVKVTDSLKKIGFKPTGVHGVNGRLVVRFIKAI